MADDTSTDSPTTGAGSAWWHDTTKVTIVTGLIAAILPVVTFINGALENRRDAARQVLEQQNTIRQTYLNRVFESGITESVQVKLFKLLAKMKSDPELQEWAAEELKESEKRVEQLETEKRDLQAQVAAAKTQLAELTQQVVSLENSSGAPHPEVQKDIAEKEAEIGKLLSNVTMYQQTAHAVSQRLGDVPATAGRLPVYIQFRGAISRAIAEGLRTKLQAAGYDAPGAERLAGTYSNEVRYFRPEDRKTAEEVAAMTGQFLGAGGCTPAGFTTRDLSASGLAAAARPGQTEIWISTNCGS